MVHIASSHNGLADSASHLFTDGVKWTVPQDIFNLIHNCYPDLDVDLFASYANHRLEKYVAWRNDLGSVTTDAFSLDWSHFHLPFIHAPFSVLTKVFQFITHDKAQAVLMVPVFPSQKWWPLLLKNMVDFPRVLPANTRLFLPWDPDWEHKLASKMTFITAKVSGKQQDREVFQQQLQNICLNNTAKAPKHDMVTFSKYGRNFVVNGIKIPLKSILDV